MRFPETGFCVSFGWFWSSQDVTVCRSKRQTRRIMAIYGYARASTLEQNVTIQEDALRRAGCEVIRSEKVSGSSRAGRSELALLLQFLRHGDTLMVTRVDRLARSIKDLQDIVHELRAAGVTLRATEQPIDTSSAAGKAFLDMLGVCRIRDQSASRTANGRD